MAASALAPKRRSRYLVAAASIVAVGVVASLLLGGPALSPAAHAASTPTVLRVGVSSEIANPNLWAVNSVSEWEAITMEYDQLMAFSPKDLRAAPGLAQGCTASDNSRTWTCTMRPGLKWSDDTPLTSKDVAFTFRMVQKYGFSYFKGYLPKGSTFSTPNDQTLVWHTPLPSNAPNVPPWVYIVPQHVWQQYLHLSAKDIRAVNVVPVVGSGPYQMTSAVQGQRWTFTRNPNYWGPTPAYQQVVFQYFDNQEAMVQALKSGQIDIVDDIDAPLLPALQSQSNISVQKVVPDCWINMAFNFGGQGPSAHPLPALQNLQVRRAIEMAIDKQGIVDKVYPGAAEPGSTIIRPLSTFWHLNIPPDKQYPFSPSKANAMLDAAGYKMGPNGLRIDPSTGKPLIINLPTSNDTQGSQDVGRLIAGYLKAIGIQVNVQPVTAGKMYDIQQSGAFDAYIWYWCGDPDPSYQLSVFSTSQTGKDGDGHLSDGNWSNAQFDALYAKQRTMLNVDQRQKVVFAAQQLVYDQVPGIVLVYPNTIQAYRNDHVQDLTPIPEKVGYIVPNYGYIPFLDAKPVSATTGASSGSGSGLPPWVWLVVVVAIAGAVAMMMRRRRNADDTEEG